MCIQSASVLQSFTIHFLKNKMFLDKKRLWTFTQLEKPHTKIKTNHDSTLQKKEKKSAARKRKKLAVTPHDRKRGKIGSKKKKKKPPQPRLYETEKRKKNSASAEADHVTYKGLRKISSESRVLWCGAGNVGRAAGSGGSGND